MSLFRRVVTATATQLDRHVSRFSVAVPEFRAPVIGVISGSTREGSVNTKLANAAGTILDDFGAETRRITLQDFDLPLYSQDIEEAGFPEGAVALKEALSACDGWIVASPEYNGLLTPLLLNTYTWASRGDPQGEIYATFKAKSAVVLGASPGGLGGMRAIGSHREVLTNLGVTVLPQSVAVGSAFQAFGEDGSVSSEPQAGMLKAACRALFEVTRADANRPATCDFVKALQSTRVVAEYGNVATVSS